MRNKQNTMKELTRETALSRFQAAVAKKKEYMHRLEDRMKAEYEARTGLAANYFFAM